MKKIIAFVFAMVCVINLMGCSNKNMNTTNDMENSTEMVKEIEENTVLVADENQSIVSGSFTVSHGNSNSPLLCRLMC